jgi:hypothetical protein
VHQCLLVYKEQIELLLRHTTNHLYLINNMAFGRGEGLGPDGAGLLDPYGAGLLDPYGPG